MENKTQAQKTARVFELLDQMHKEKVKYLTKIAMQHSDRDDLKTLFRKLDSED